MEARFLNIDLDLESTEDLSLIVSEFGNDVIVMRYETENGLSSASFEIARDMNGADSIFTEYFRLVDCLSDAARHAWDACGKRVFDLGFSGGTEPHAIHELLREETLQELARLGGSIAITVYAAGLDEMAT